jgi:hypothetical protein
MCPRRFLGLLAPTSFLASFLLAPALAGQVPDSALFHKGQWGVDFRVGSGFAGVGALHFTSPTHAMLLDLSGGYSHGSTTASPASHGNSVDASLSLGTRAYHQLDPHVYRWTTLGLSFIYERHSATQGTVTQTIKGYGAGVFVNLGGTWLVTPHLGLGAQWQVDLTYSHSSASAPFPNPSPGTTDIVTVQLARVALTGQFYF